MESFILSDFESSLWMLFGADAALGLLREYTGFMALVKRMNPSALSGHCLLDQHA
jgi:hypothetical protein